MRLYQILNEGSINDIQKMISSGNAADWIREGDMEVYVRVSNRNIKGQSIPAIDLSNIISPENSRGKGIFTRFLDNVEELAFKNGMVVYVENIINERLKNFLINRGYTPTGKSAFKIF
jgi:hypothetical protein